MGIAVVVNVECRYGWSCTVLLVVVCCGCIQYLSIIYIAVKKCSVVVIAIWLSIRIYL